MKPTFSLTLGIATLLLQSAGCNDGQTQIVRTDGASYDDALLHEAKDGLLASQDSRETPDFISAGDAKTDTQPLTVSDGRSPESGISGDLGLDVTPASLETGSSLTDAIPRLDFPADTQQAGALFWTRQYGTLLTDIANGVATDKAGNIFVTVVTECDLDNGCYSGLQHTLVIKYDTYGMKQWIRLVGSTDSEIGNDVTTDEAGNVYLAGYALGDLDGNINAGGWDLFVVKYDTNGTRLWTQCMGTPADDLAMGVAVDQSGNVFVAGYTAGDLDGNVNAGGQDLFVVKYDTNGVRQWTRQMGTTADDAANGVATDGDGNVLVVGYTSGDLDGNMNVGKWDEIMVKYDANGVKQWTQQMGTTASEEANGIAKDIDGNILVVGVTKGGLDGNKNAGGLDLFVMKLDANGAKLWIRQMGTTSDDTAMAVSTDKGGNIYVVGHTQGSLDGNVNAGGEDVLIVKYDKNGAKLWTRQMGSSLNDMALKVSTDDNGNVCMVGYTMGDFGGNVNVGEADAFITKFVGE